MIIVQKQNFKTALAKKGFTYKTFAHQLGVSLAHICVVATTKKGVSPFLSTRMCQELNVEFDDIFEVTERRKKENAE